MSREKRTIVRGASERKQDSAQTPREKKPLPNITLEDLDETQSVPKIRPANRDDTQDIPKITLEDLDEGPERPRRRTEDLDSTQDMPKITLEDLDETRSMPKITLEDLDETKSLPEVDVEDLDATRSMPKVQIEDLDETWAMPTVSVGESPDGPEISTGEVEEALRQASQETSAAEAVLDGLQTAPPVPEEPDGSEDIRVTWEESIQTPPSKRLFKDQAAETGQEEPQPSEQEQANRKRRRLVVAAAAAAAVVVLAVGGFGVFRMVENQRMTSYYETHFLPGTWINGQDCSNMTAEEVSAVFSQVVQKYSLTIQGVNGAEDRISAAEINLSMEADVDFQDLIDAQDHSQWRKAEENPTSLTFTSGWTYDQQLLEDRLADSPLFQNMTDSEDAEIVYDEATSQYVLYREIVGTWVDMDQVTLLAQAAVETLEPVLSLEEAGCYPEVKMADAAMEQAVVTMNLYNQAQISYTFGDTEEVLAPETLRASIVCDPETSQVTLNTGELQIWVTALAEKYDTVGTSRSFRSTRSGTVTVGGGNYGWRINQEETLAQITSAIETGGTVTGDPVYSQTGATRDGSDIGDTYIEVDLTNQMLYYYENGSRELSTAIVSGRVSRNTTTVKGVYYIYSKEQNRVLTGEDYETPVDYWMPFYEGYGLHDASWRSSFGGDIYLTNGSYGSVNMSTSAARRLYNMISVGTPVIVFGGEDTYVAPEESETTAPEIQASTEAPTQASTESQVQTSAETTAQDSSTETSETSASSTGTAESSANVPTLEPTQNSPTEAPTDPAGESSQESVEVPSSSQEEIVEERPE